MTKKTLIYAAISLLSCTLIVTIINNINSTSRNNIEDNSQPSEQHYESSSDDSSDNKTTITYLPDIDELTIYTYDYNLDDEEISMQIDSAIKQLPHSNDELLDFIEDIKQQLKAEDTFTYDDTGTYDLCTDKQVGQYKVHADATDTEYLGYPLVYIRIFK